MCQSLSFGWKKTTNSDLSTGILIDLGNQYGIWLIPHDSCLYWMGNLCLIRAPRKVKILMSLMSQQG